MSEGSPPIFDYEPTLPRRRRTLPWRRLRPTRKRFVGAAICALLVTVVYLRWPRLTEDMVDVTRSEQTQGRTIVEYRMSTPFEVAFRRGIQEGSNPPRYEPVVSLHSRYDLLRGEHYVLFELTSGTTLGIECDGKRTHIQPETIDDARQARWSSPSRNGRFAKDVGFYIAYFSGPRDPFEYLDHSVRTTPPSQ